MVVKLMAQMQALLDIYSKPLLEHDITKLEPIIADRAKRFKYTFIHP